MPIRRQKIKNLAESMLEKYCITHAPIDVARIITQEGLFIHRARLDGQLSGFLFRNESEVIIGVNTKHSSTRQTFTLAHELGHYLLHDQEQLHVDRDFKVRLRNDVSSLGLDDDEREANLFAASLLMPEAFIDEDLIDEIFIDMLDDKLIHRLAKRYAVSTQALINRLKNLGYISD